MHSGNEKKTQTVPTNVNAANNANGPYECIYSVIFGSPRVITKFSRFWNMNAMLTTVPLILMGRISDAVSENAGAQQKP